MCVCIYICICSMYVFIVFEGMTKMIATRCDCCCYRILRERERGATERQARPS